MESKDVENHQYKEESLWLCLCEILVFTPPKSNKIYMQKLNCEAWQKQAPTNTKPCITNNVNPKSVNDKEESNIPSTSGASLQKVICNLFNPDGNSSPSATNQITACISLESTFEDDDDNAWLYGAQTFSSNATLVGELLDYDEGTSIAKQQWCPSEALKFWCWCGQTFAYYSNAKVIEEKWWSFFYKRE